MAMALIAGSVSLPALAEGGMYPSAGLLLGLLFLYALGIPIAIAVAAYACLKRLFKQKQPKTAVLFWVALFTWNTGLALYVMESIKLPFNDEWATFLGVVLSLGITVAFGFWTGRAKPVGSE